jgi:hypothetical protein
MSSALAVGTCGAIDTMFNKTAISTRRAVISTSPGGVQIETWLAVREQGRYPRAL